MTATEQRVRRVYAGRYEIGDYQIVRAASERWWLIHGLGDGARSATPWSCWPTKREAVAQARMLNQQDEPQA